MHGVLRAKNGHPKVNFRYVIGPTFSMPTKIIPYKISYEETKILLEHGERDAKAVITNLIKNPEKEI